MDAYLSSFDDDRLVIALRGEIDCANAESLLQLLLAMASPATGEVALDMARVDFIDCAGVHMLIALDRDIQIRGGSMRIVAISPAAALLFELVYAVGALPGFYTPVPPTPGLSVSSHS